MSLNIEKEINQLIAREGGYINHPSDKGGPTNFGVTQKTLTHWLGRNATAADVKALTKRQAFEIYYAQYYIKPDVKSLPELIQPIVLDMVVNSGKRGITLLQHALFCRGFDTGKVDGTIGPKTIAAANAAAEQLGNELIVTLVRRRVIFYEGLVKADDTQRVFLPGWIARAESFLPEKTA